ncbi:MAG TPA: helix-turn-helix transcriptional regulator [Rhodospirillales bacterium]|nr:helix-turn-helix transcriptional regulator [Rhodospirillales bacterium]
MRSSDFKRWRKSLDFSQKQAAEALGLKRRMVQYYEKGERDGDKVAVPKAVRLACWALSAGVSDYHGPEIRPEAGRSPASDSEAGSADEEQSAASPEGRAAAKPGGRRVKQPAPAATRGS